MTNGRPQKPLQDRKLLKLLTYPMYMGDVGSSEIQVSGNNSVLYQSERGAESVRRSALRLAGLVGRVRGRRDDSDDLF